MPNRELKFADRIFEISLFDFLRNSQKNEDAVQVFVASSASKGRKFAKFPVSLQNLNNRDNCSESFSKSVEHYVAYWGAFAPSSRAAEGFSLWRYCSMTSIRLSTFTDLHRQVSIPSIGWTSDSELSA